MAGRAAVAAIAEGGAVLARGDGERGESARGASCSRGLAVRERGLSASAGERGLSEAEADGEAKPVGGEYGAVSGARWRAAIADWSESTSRTGPP